MKEKLEIVGLVIGGIILAVVALAAILVINPVFWLAVIAVTLIVCLFVNG